MLKALAIKSRINARFEDFLFTHFSIAQDSAAVKERIIHLYSSEGHIGKRWKDMPPLFT